MIYNGEEKSFLYKSKKIMYTLLLYFFCKNQMGMFDQGIYIFIQIIKHLYI